MMKTVIIVQARMGSGRLPGKVLRPVCGKPMLAHVAERVRACRAADQVAVATSRHPLDDVIADWAHSFGVHCYQGSEEDLVERYYQTARKLDADLVVRITADCPFIDPGVVDRVIRAFQEANPRPDYAANVLQRTWPRGLDVDVFSRTLVEQLYRDAAPGPEREHLDLHVLNNPGRFSVLSVRGEQQHADKRWTVDTADDLALVRRVYEALYPKLGLFRWRDVLELLRRQPDWEEINRHVRQRYDDPAPAPRDWKAWASLTVAE
jgi:spore coat polysaccharide biosynthesis protein SpsF